MLRRRTATLLASLVLLVPGWRSAPAAPPAADERPAINLESLLGRMTDLRWLAAAPEPGERTVQYSSYDRASKLGPDGKLVNPFANGDAGHYLRVDRRPDGSREFVLAEAEGPGFVSRIWSANPSGQIRIYVDGAAAPALEADFAALTRGKVAPFLPPFGQETSRGCTLYFPLPFAKSIKIVTDKGGMYFQVAVTTYQAGAPVESYSAESTTKYADAMKHTRERLTAGAGPAAGGAGAVATTSARPIAPGQTIQLLKVEKKAALSGMTFQVEAADRNDALARCLLTITFDGAARPQVAVPLGDFFGSGPGLNPYVTLPSRVDAKGDLVAHWYMPFDRSARVSVTNQSSQSVRVGSQFAIASDVAPSPALHFHARWLYEDGLQTKAADGTKEWPALRVEGGAGRFVGLLLNVYNPTSAWWGEGDEKVYVDGEAFPSTFGTGTEDYFGYAWCDPHLYAHPYHAQTRCDGPGNRGYTSNVRYHVLDAIPFRNSLVFDLEVWHWRAVKVQYASIAYFYAAPGVGDDQAVPDLKGRVAHPPGEGVHREKGVIEGEKLHVREVSGGAVPNQDMMGWGEEWSDASQLWWTGAKVGQVLTLDLPVEKPGKVAVSAALTRAPDYGIVTLAIDGKPLGEPIDLYAKGVEHTGALKLGTVDLDAGKHALTLTITGKNPKSKDTLVGVDWIKLEPAR